MLNEGPLTGSGGSGRNDLLGRLAVAEPDHSNVRFGSKADAGGQCPFWVESGHSATAIAPAVNRRQQSASTAGQLLSVSMVAMPSFPRSFAKSNGVWPSSFLGEVGALFASSSLTSSTLPKLAAR